MNHLKIIYIKDRREVLVTVTTVDADPAQTVKRVLIRSEKVAG